MPNPDQDAIAEYVRAVSQQIALPIAAEYEPLVREDFARIAAIADFLMKFPLDQNVEPAPVFEP